MITTWLSSLHDIFILLVQSFTIPLKFGSTSSHSTSRCVAWLRDSSIVFLWTFLKSRWLITQVPNQYWLWMWNWHCLVVLWLIRIGNSHAIKVSTSFHRTNSLIISVHLLFLQSFPRKWLSFKCLPCLLLSHLSIFSISAKRVKLLLKVFIFDPQIFDSIILNQRMSDFKLRYFLQLC